MDNLTGSVFRSHQNKASSRSVTPGRYFMAINTYWTDLVKIKSKQHCMVMKVLSKQYNCVGKEIMNYSANQASLTSMLIAPMAIIYS
jgi:hypothetical protein